MAVNPMNNKNLSRTHSKELAKNNRRQAHPEKQRL